MADEPGAEDLEDGELWLPSDFFSPDEVNQVPDKTLSNFLHRQPHNCGLYKPLTTLQRFKPAVRYEISGVPGDIFDHGAGKSWTGCSQVYQLQRLNPVQAQMETFFMGDRAQGQLLNRVFLNRISTRAGHVGTGVFLPRVSNRTAKAARNQNHHFIVKGPRTNNIAQQ